MVQRNERWPAGHPAERGRPAQSRRRQGLQAEDIRPLIKHRVFAPGDHAHNARIRDELYNQRSICETVNSVIKRSDGGALQARSWYCQFHEIALTAAVYNLELAFKSINPRFSADSIKPNQLESTVVGPNSP